MKIRWSEIEEAIGEVILYGVIAVGIAGLGLLLMLWFAGCGILRSPTPPTTNAQAGLWYAATPDSFTNDPRIPRVAMSVQPDGTWALTCDPYAVPGQPGQGYVSVTCRDTLRAVPFAMSFSGSGADTSGFSIFMSIELNDQIQELRMTHYPSFIVNEVEVGPIIAGSLVLTVLGNCQASRTKLFWLKQAVAP